MGNKKAEAAPKPGPTLHAPAPCNNCGREAVTLAEVCSSCGHSHPVDPLKPLYTLPKE